MDKNNEIRIEGTIRKILVVDDDVKVRKLLHRLLSKEGYQVMTAPSGTSALAMLKKDRPDLIILDQRMPGIDGLETMRKIRGFDKEIPIVMLTGYPTGELQIAALKLEANDFLMKGTNTRRFLKALEEVIERQKTFALRKEPPGKGGKVLVVDDEPEVKQLLERFLHKQRHEVRTIDSGEKALEILKSGDYQPDVALVDIKLPGMDGLVTLKEIRNFSNNIGVILMTGEDDPALREQALELGALECFKKPLDLEHLELTIRIRGLGQTSPLT